MTRITLTRRSSDWHACIEGSPVQWVAGRDPEEAIRKLKQSFPEMEFGEVVYGGMR